MDYPKQPQKKIVATTQAMACLKAIVESAYKHGRPDIVGDPTVLVFGDCLQVYYTTDQGDTVQTTVYVSDAYVRIMDKNENIKEMTE